MVSTADKWIRIFDLPETSTHKKGYTLYKVISLLYPENNPDAIIKISVWKRYNEFKQLYKEIKPKYLALKLKDKLPNLPKSAYFKRFDKIVIKERRSAIQNFLECIASTPALYTSTEFVNFFKNSQTPLENADSTICTIRAELNLPNEPEYFPLYVPNSDEDYEPSSDTDSITTLSSSTQMFECNDCSKTSMDKLSKNMDNSLGQTNKPDLQDTVSLSTTTISNESAQAEVDTFYAAIGTDIPEYVIDASQHINLAVQYESDQKYDDAFNEYKSAIDVLLSNVKIDKSADRRQMIRFQIDKYMLRAEKIYNVHLSNEMRNLKEITNKYNYSEITKSLADLHKYKVLKVIDSGMLVLHSEIQRLYYIKVVEKSTIFSYDDLILPDDVPFMVKLENYYVSENAIFLILEYCDGTKLCDYIRQRCKSNSNNFYNTFDNNHSLSDNESECSYADLINEYATCRNRAEEANHSNRADGAVDEIFNGTSNSAESQGNYLESGRRKSSTLSSEFDFDIELDELVPMKYVVKWSAQLLLALEKLYTLGVVVKDLQMKNLLINEREDIVLTYQCKVSSNSLLSYSNYVNFQHELYNLNKISDRAHLWSFGVILYELLVGMPLIKTHPEGLNTCSVLHIPKHVKPEGRSLLKQLLSFEASECGINEIDDVKMHPFYHSISWDSLLSQYNH